MRELGNHAVDCAKQHIDHLNTPMDQWSTYTTTPGNYGGVHGARLAVHTLDHVPAHASHAWLHAWTVLA